MKKILLPGVCAVMLSSLAAQAQTQDTTILSLQRRVDSLEQRFHRAQVFLERNIPQDRTQTRAAIEGNRYGGFVVADMNNTRLTIGGYVQADFIYDFKQIGSTDAFVTNSIPADNVSEGRLTFSPRQTRLTISSSSNTTKGELKTIFELDLFNSNGTSTPRLRHAWGQIGRWGAGQYWSTFMDIDVFPNILDYEGPNAMVFVRQIQLRYTQPLSKNTTLALAVENPGSDTKFPADSGISSRTVYPDVVAQFRYNITPSSHLQLAGLFHPITYKDAATKNNNEIGWGANLTGVIELSQRTKDNFVFQATYGQGIARYFNDLGGLGYDAILKPNDVVKSLPVYALMGFYDHWWGNKWSSTVGWSHMHVTYDKSQAGTDYAYTDYAVANLLFYPGKFVKVGLEYLYGKHKTVDARSGDDHRLQFSMLYKF
ncbi:hypothetical protein LX64_00574 [Chitinophaga skermanii]|uniref:Porin-like protein n=1 Tax=Chitinophaga skermanii TaxID=331697 RepID=A0A327RAL8_9BACT|nr:DcaP family trimeric outer membrane transporter [Chitinophaga skermanii]RAJ10967.1 hypothetical protein LX64_00574 [Chitinophaga skermanii]